MHHPDDDDELTCERDTLTVRVTGATPKSLSRCLNFGVVCLCVFGAKSLLQISGVSDEGLVFLPNNRGETLFLCLFGRLFGHTTTMRTRRG